MQTSTRQKNLARTLLLAVAFVAGLALFFVLGVLLWRYTTAERPSPDRLLAIRSAEGDAELVERGGAVPRAPVAGEAMPFGGEIRTGAHGLVVLESDDGTVAVIGPDSSFRLTLLRGTPETARTRLQTAGGSISLFRFRGPALPAGAGFEVQVPGAVLAIRGSSMGVQYSAGGQSTTLVCLTGTCASAGAGGQAADLSGGQQTVIDTAGNAGSVSAIAEEELQRQMDALAAAEDGGGGPLSVDVSNCSNELGGRTEIDAGREYVAITRPGCWATPEEALANKNSVAVSLTVDGAGADFIGYGPSAECTPGGNPTGTYNFAAYFLVGPFPAGERTVEAVHNHTDGYVNEEMCVLQVR